MSLIITSGFPRDLPERSDGLLPFESATFEPAYNQVSHSTRGGKIGVVNLGVPLWVMTFATHVLPYEEALEYVSWAQSLRGGALLFKAWHPWCRYPLNYPQGFTGMKRAGTSESFDGTLTVASINSTRDQIIVTGLPNAFAFKRGDMISIPIGATGRTLHRLMAPSTASGLGAANLTVEPTLPLSVVADVTATVAKPWCLAVLNADSIRAPLQSGHMGRVEFSATQTF